MINYEATLLLAQYLATEQINIVQINVNLVLDVYTVLSPIIHQKLQSPLRVSSLHEFACLQSHLLAYSQLERSPS